MRPRSVRLLPRLVNRSNVCGERYLVQSGAPRLDSIPNHPLICCACARRDNDRSAQSPRRSTAHTHHTPSLRELMPCCVEAPLGRHFPSIPDPINHGAGYVSAITEAGQPTSEAHMLNLLHDALAVVLRKVALWALRHG